MMKKLFVNGKDLSEFGVYVNGVTQYNGSNYDFTEQIISGRNGGIYVDNYRTENIEITYNCMIHEHMKMNMQALKDYLYKNAFTQFGWSLDYNTIQDEYEPYFYRIGYFVGNIEMSPFVDKVSFFDLTFNCFGTKFYVSGNEKIPLNRIVENGGIIKNPYYMNAKPLIYLYKETKCTNPTTMNINGNQIVIQPYSSINNTHVYVSGEDYMIYQLDNNEYHMEGSAVFLYNPNFTISGEFPLLVSGENSFSITTDCDLKKSYMIPRWCTL